MGDAVVSALVKDVLGRLTSELIKEFGLLWGYKKDILCLREDFTKIQAVLEDAEAKHIKEKAVELWLKSLRSASLEVENVLDEISTEALLQHLHKKRGIGYMVRAFFSSTHNQLMFRVRVAHNVKAIRRKLDVIASKRFELKLTPLDVISHLEGIEGEIPDRETSSFVHSSRIFGRDAEAKMVIEKICNKDIEKYDDDELLVYGIWGMGGVGKTTLAQLVYNHERANQYFDLKCWIYVSQNFQVKEIIKGIITSIDKNECTLTRLDELQKSLRNKLRGKKFLIVLDDVWIEESEKTKWNQLSEILNCGAKGSIVLMTTRSQATSQMMVKFPELQHHLECLSEDDSWLLFQKLAFHGRQRAAIIELKPIGREIVEKCKGLPLAVKTLGSLMWSKSGYTEWQQVKDNNIWELQENEVLPALKLSYDSLLPHLKRCFAYCCLFPKGYQLKKDELIPLWVANGFIPPRGDIDLYALGEEAYNCLVWRSFFVFKANEFSIDRCIMHDMMHDMARHVMRDDCLVVEPGKDATIPSEVLHLSLMYHDFHLSSRDIRNLSSLRSIFMFEKPTELKVINNHPKVEPEEFKLEKCFRHVHLRVLYLCRIGLMTLPDSIYKLKHLKYLNLSYSHIKLLPDSIIYLQNLQVLILSCCRKLFKLPKGLRYMGRLKVLDLAFCNSLLYLPIGIKELTSLQRLLVFPVGKESGAKIDELGGLNLLEGELQISRLENVGGLSEAKRANLKGKKNLSVLGLTWSYVSYQESKWRSFEYHEKVLEGIEPNPCLKRLEICEYLGKIISPTWIANLRNLVEISFSHCKNCKHTPALGMLPNLRVISLFDMESLMCFHDNDTKMLGDTTNMFRSLQELSINYCPRLVSLPRNFPKLKVLKLSLCTKLVSLPDEIQYFKDLNELVIENCKYLNKRYARSIGVDWPKISHIPNITIYPKAPYEYEDEDEFEDGDENEYEDDQDEINDGW